MFKSLRWRLQVWQAAVLLVVLTSFGVIVYRLQWETRLQRIDADLHSASGVVRNQMLRLNLISRPDRRRQRNRDDVRPDEQGARSDQTAPQNATSRPDAANDAEADRPNPPPPNRQMQERQNRDLAEFESLFHGDDEHEARYYYVLWNDKGELLDKRPSGLDIEYPHLQVDSAGIRKPIIRERRADHVYRELIRVGQSTRLLVGQSLEKDLAAHHQAGLLLAAMGLVILAAGVLGGGWLSARAIRSITVMTSAAELISVQNLSERISLEETDNELGTLATVLNATFDRLQAAFERQTQFTADASHELRTPLSVISSHTELALARPRSADDYRAALQTCQRASKRMRLLIDALLILARFDSGIPSLKRDRMDLDLLIQDCIELVRPLANERDIQIECRTKPVKVIADWDKLAQVVTNLLSNAIRYNVDGGRIIVSDRIEDGQAVISVEDTGIGIAADQLTHIFERFYQVDKARSPAEGSCGLGLSICKTIVEAHAGTITATSQSGAGTTIEVRIPTDQLRLPSDSSIFRTEQLVSVASGS